VASICWFQVQRGNPGYALIWYAILSSLLLKFPTLVHKTRTRFVVPEVKRGLSRMIIAHRGGSWEQPENTLQAFDYALKNGAQFLEFDVRMTRDGVIIVCHDDDFGRLCGVNKRVRDVNHDQLPKFKKEMPMHFSALNKDAQF